MRTKLLAGLFTALAVAGSPACSVPPEVPLKPQIPLEEVVRLPAPGFGGPTAIRWIPKGGRLTWLHAEDGGLVRSLWVIDPETGERRVAVLPPGGGVSESGLTLEERLLRERQRERGLGITTYAWTRDGARLLVPLKGAVWVQDGLDGELRELVPADPSGPALDPVASPDGRTLAFVRDAEIHVVPIAGGAPRALTRGARGTGRTHGLAEYVAQEEMKRSHGYWWSPDSARIAYTEVDETHIPIWRIPHEGKESPTWEDHRYPFAGADNAIVSLWVVPVAGGAPVRMDLSVGGEWEYLARVAWLHDGSLLAVVQDRRQRRLELIRLDPASGRGERVHSERSETFLELHDLLRPLENEPGAFLWGTEASGFLHLVKVGADGAVTAVTRGEWQVDELCAVDEARGLAWIAASEASPLERHLYEVRLDGAAAPRRLTTEPGWHTPLVDPKRSVFVDSWSARDRVPRVELRSLADGAPVRELYRAEDPRVTALQLQAPEPVVVTARDGETLHGALYRPDGPGPHPLVVVVYGGPHVQRVANRWDLASDLRAWHLARRGVAVFKLDNRGSARRGTAFAAAILGNAGDLEIRDQVDGVAQLVRDGVADPARVGITGWSYGGYLSAMAMMRAPETFAVAVAGAPVTHWDGYDTHYTERYMGLPAENPEGYRASSVMAHVGDLRGRLMIVHGMLDENVHFRHTARLVNALIAARKDYELLLFPDERHSPRGEADRVYMEQKTVEFLLRGLNVPVPASAAAPPARR